MSALILPHALNVLGIDRRNRLTFCIILEIGDVGVCYGAPPQLQTVLDQCPELSKTLASRERCAFFVETSTANRSGACVSFRHATPVPCFLHSREVLWSISFEPNKWEQCFCPQIHIGLRRNGLQMANGILQGVCGRRINPRSGNRVLPQPKYFLCPGMQEAQGPIVMRSGRESCKTIPLKPSNL